MFAFTSIFDLLSRLRQQKTHFCLPAKVRFLNDVRYANDVCLTAHWGKHRIIAERSGATSYLRSKFIISPQGDASFEDIQGLHLDLFRKLCYNKLTDNQEFVGFGARKLIKKRRYNMKRMGKIFETIFSIFVGILFIVPAIAIVLIDCISNRIFLLKQFKRIKQAGYKISKAKVQRKKVYLFTFKRIVIKFLPNEIYDISFDGGETYTNIIETNIGTSQEIEHLRELKHQYQTSDYRDRDMYDSTEDFIKFILKNITLDK